MSWGEIKKVNSDLTTPLNERIDTKATDINTRVGQNGDAANASGSLHAKANKLLRRWAVASETIQAYADTDRMTAPVLKEFISMIGGTVRVKFSAWTNGGTYTVYLYTSGTSSPQLLVTGTNTSAQAYSFDVVVLPGTAIRLQGNPPGGAVVHLANARLCFTVSGDQNTEVMTSIN